ncbi:hypothetical protein [Gramella sp. AN32]|uniref:Uncharacterized protein n=1 Tax=Christiangramia antarctica TaxID=2058158 RepID=A0ABW5X9X2_9FLAO|nr:hypothetical protein [Gramella sp. AN32]MCM4156455.1 hypothetical protein [Gramella sp. AN32]
MKSKKDYWSKKELQIYILLLCANVDSEETEEELNMIKSRFKEKKFEKIYGEFRDDSEEESLEKIQDSIAVLKFSQREINQLKSEMQQIFFSDRIYKLMERNMERILDNIIY